jgi:hypothetical protein
MPRQGHSLGYLSTPGMPTPEKDLVGCGHCQAQIVTTGGNGQSAPVPMCHACFRFVCEACREALQRTGCVTWEERFRLHERKASARSAFLLAAGAIVD